MVFWHIKFHIPIIYTLRRNYHGIMIFQMLKLWYSEILNWIVCHTKFLLCDSNTKYMFAMHVKWIESVLNKYMLYINISWIHQMMYAYLISVYHILYQSSISILVHHFVFDYLVVWPQLVKCFNVSHYDELLNVSSAHLGCI